MVCASRSLGFERSELGVQFEEAPCRLCGGGQWNVLVEAQDPLPGPRGLWFAVVQCKDCGLCFTNPRPTIETIGRFYPTDYHPHCTSRKTKELFTLSYRVRRWLWGDDEDKTLPWHGEGRLLDFGCGRGRFMERLHAQGWNVTGVDASATAVDRIRHSLMLPALVGSLPHPALEEASFDVITMWQSLEHVHDPLRILRAAHRLLVSGGKLVVAVPNIDSLAFRWFGAAWNALDLPRHLTHFSPATLEVLLARAGFEVGPVRMLRRSGWLRDSARLAVRTGEPGPWRNLLKSRFGSSLASWYAARIHQADCMMVTASKR